MNAKNGLLVASIFLSISVSHLHAREPEKICWNDSFAVAAKKLAVLVSSKSAGVPRLIFKKEINSKPEIKPTSDYTLQIISAAYSAPNGLVDVIQKNQAKVIDQYTIRMDTLHIPKESVINIAGVDLGGIEAGWFTINLESGIDLEIRESKDKQGAADLINTLLSINIRTASIMSDALSCESKNKKTKTPKEAAVSTTPNQKEVAPKKTLSKKQTTASSAKETR